MLFNNDLSFFRLVFFNRLQAWVDLFCEILFDVQVPQILVLRRVCVAFRTTVTEVL